MYQPTISDVEAMAQQFAFALAAMSPSESTEEVFDKAMHMAIEWTSLKRIKRMNDLHQQRYPKWEPLEADWSIQASQNIQLNRGKKYWVVVQEGNDEPQVKYLEFSKKLDNFDSHPYQFIDDNHTPIEGRYVLTAENSEIFTDEFVPYPPIEPRK